MMPETLQQWLVKSILHWYLLQEKKKPLNEWIDTSDVSLMVIALILSRHILAAVRNWRLAHCLAFCKLTLDDKFSMGSLIVSALSEADLSFGPP